jgi:predicted DNA-binding transcriptional regulator YafY
LDLHHAIGENRRVWMRYYTASRNEHSERTVSPYHLYNVHGDWYLIAFDDKRKSLRNFSVGRIEDWQVLAETFERDPKFSIHDWMSGAFQTERGGEVLEVVLRFDAQQARYIRERHWHDTQQIEELADTPRTRAGTCGGLILRFRTGGLGEVKRWVMQYGGHVEVLEPEELRNELLQELQKMAKLYGIQGKEDANDIATAGTR